MKIFVAGATGAIGRQLLPQLVSAGHQVIGLTRSALKCPHIAAYGAVPVVASVLDAPAMMRTLAEHRPDVVICELTDLPPDLDIRKIKEIYTANNRVREEGTRNVIEAAAAVGVRRAVVESMAMWYAPDGAGARAETAPLFEDAPEPVGTAVRALKRMEGHALASGVESIILRYGAFFGPGTWYARDGGIYQQTLKRRFPLIGGGEGVYSFIHVADAAAATVAAVERAAPGTYNVVDDSPLALREWLPAYAAAIGAPAPLKVPLMVGRLVGGGLVEWAATIPPASNAKIKGELGWTPSLPKAPPHLGAIET